MVKSRSAKKPRNFAIFVQENRKKGIRTISKLFIYGTP